MGFLTQWRTLWLPPGPDAQLYLNVAENLGQGRGLIDTFTNREIIPTLGHPLSLAVSQLLGILQAYDRVALFIAGCLFFFSIWKILKQTLVSLALSSFFALGLPAFIQYNVESSLLISSQLFLTSLVFAWGSRKPIHWILVGITLAWFILIRPILFPPALLLMAAALVLQFLRRQCTPSWSSAIRWTALGAALPLFIAGSLSHQKHDDFRFVTGTYSAIPLYCAFNPYIPLKTLYGTELFRNLQESVHEIATAPLEYDGSWKKRDRILKDLVVQFIRRDPKTALQGFLWRLSRYTWSPGPSAQGPRFYLWMLSSLLLLRFFRRKNEGPRQTLFPLGILLILVCTFIIGMQSLFVFVGDRYYTITIPFLLTSFAVNLSLILKQKKESV